MTNCINKTANSIRVSMEFLLDSTLNMKEKALYMILASYCKEGEDRCSPSLRQELSEATGLVPRTLISTLRCLEDKGYIKIEKQTDLLGGYYRTDTHYLNNRSHKDMIR